MVDFYDEVGKMALGSRLRRLSELFTDEAARIYSLYNVGLEPRWFPVFFVLAEQSGLSIKEVAGRIRQTHASVSQVVKEMKKRHLVEERKDDGDGRKTLLCLTDKGRALIPPLKEQTTDVGSAAEELLSQMHHDLWKAMEETEYLLAQQSLSERVRNKKREREGKAVTLLPYSAAYQPDFKRLNVEWIETYFQLEERDLLSLNNPQSYILDPGGEILLAEYGGEIVGVVALVKLDEETFEMAKMAVSPKAQGKGVGELLGRAAIRKARSLGAKKVYLESNTLLKPAINLYHKLGFRKVKGNPSPYERCNIQMELPLTEPV
jgi:DNA-binding MarR family transcriptional regulator/N-acetylglutamate synthase-like GNAT family acetyltransferase